MYFNKKQQWLIFIGINALVLFILIFFPFYRAHLAGTPLMACKFYKYTKLYCTGCGGTRAFNALVNFRIIDSFKYNPIVPIGAVAFIIYEVTMIVYLIKGTKRPFFVKPWMVWAFLTFWFTYAIIRDILLICGIDMLANI